jgi:hypothetical protein
LTAGGATLLSSDSNKAKPVRRKLTETTHTSGDTRRIVQTFTQGVRCVTIDHGGECWTSYLIIPRLALIAGIRRMRKRGFQYDDCNWYDVTPGADRWGCPAGDGGPGRPFAREPYRMRSSRRFVVMVQSGGLDF